MTSKWASVWWLSTSQLFISFYFSINHTWPLLRSFFFRGVIFCAAQVGRRTAPTFERSANQQRWAKTHVNVEDTYLSILMDYIFSFKIFLKLNSLRYCNELFFWAHPVSIYSMWIGIVECGVFLDKSQALYPTLDISTSTHCWTESSQTT